MVVEAAEPGAVARHSRRPRSAGVALEVARLVAPLVHQAGEIEQLGPVVVGLDGPGGGVTVGIGQRPELGAVSTVKLRAQMGAMSGERDERPWGSYEVLEDAPTHKVKRIEVRPGQRLSYQRHEGRAEHWFVVAGQAQVTLDDATIDLAVGQAVDIPRRSAHRMANVGDEPLVFIEVQTGDSFAEDDIERLDDDYDR